MFSNFLEETSLFHVRPRVELPTWVGAQGYFNVLDHFLVPVGLPGARCEVHSDAFFPSDHSPITLHLTHVSAPAPVAILEHRKRFRLFPPDPEKYTSAFNASFAGRTERLEVSVAETIFVRLRDALVEAARDAYGEPVAYDRIPVLVRLQQEHLSTYLRGHPTWWTKLEHLHQVLTLRRAVHTAWYITNLASQLGLVRTTRHDHPSTKAYRRIFKGSFSPSVEPKYAVHLSVCPRLRAHVTLDQLCQRHLAPLSSLSVPYIRNMMGWAHLSDSFRFPLLTVPAIRLILDQTPHTTPFRDLVEYVLLRRLSDANLVVPVSFYNLLLQGARVPGMHHGDFTLLPKKQPNGIVGNGRPLSNLSVLWKVLSMHLAGHLQKFLCAQLRISREQFAMWERTSVVDVLRVVHDWLLSRWAQGLSAWLILDDVIHAFGSLAHDTVQAALLAVGVDPSAASLLVYATRAMLLHMGGYQGVEEAFARYETGMGQGDPLSALLYCLLGELRAAFVLLVAGCVTAPAGSLRRLGWIDDTSWLASTHADAQNLLAQLPAAGAATNLFSDNLKTLAVGTELRLNRVIFLEEPLYMLGSPLRRPTATDYIRLLGRMPYRSSTTVRIWPSI